jgi:hypothetical protein
MPADRRLPNPWWTLIGAAAAGAVFVALCLRVEASFEDRWKKTREGMPEQAAARLLGEPTRRLDRRFVQTPDDDLALFADSPGEWWVYDVSTPDGVVQHLLWVHDGHVTAKRLGRPLGEPSVGRWTALPEE